LFAALKRLWVSLLKSTFDFPGPLTNLLHSKFSSSNNSFEEVGDDVEARVSAILTPCHHLDQSDELSSVDFFCLSHVFTHESSVQITCHDISQSRKAQLGAKFTRKSLRKLLVGDPHHHHLNHHSKYLFPQLV
jgi:hypothetical protein